MCRRRIQVQGEEVFSPVEEGSGAAATRRSSAGMFESEDSLSSESP